MSSMRQIVEPAIVYVGAAFHYLLQLSNISQIEVHVNIAVGVLVAIYTLTKIIDWARSLRPVKKEKNNAQDS